MAFGFGLKPEAQLADLAGIPFATTKLFANGCRQPMAMAAPALGLGLTSRETGYDRAVHRRPRSAVCSPLQRCWRISALRRKPSIAARCGVNSPPCAAFSVVSRAPLPGPRRDFASMDDNLAVCRCEDVTAGEIRRTVLAALGPTDINRVKALTRVGMGRCQGRFRGLAAAEIVAAAADWPLEAAGRSRGQAPVKPLPPTAREVKRA